MSSRRRNQAHREDTPANNPKAAECAALETSAAALETQRRLAQEVQELRARNARLEQQLADRTRLLQQGQTLEAMGRLAGGVAHDFNNLLGAILGCLYTARMQGELPAPVVEDLEQAQQLCKRGGQLTAQLLGVARQQGGRVEAIDGYGLLRDLGTLLKGALPPSIELRLEFGEGHPVVRGDRSHLHTALLNLALNAQDAMPQGGTLTLRTWAPPGRWLIQVEDTGFGIPKELHHKVFEPFFTTKAVGTGTGLGLSLVHATAAELGGWVRLEPASERGARFTLSLPVVKAGTNRPQRGRRRSFLLVVEDEAPVARMMVAALESQGHQVLLAATGADALELLHALRSQVALVLLDLVLPGMSAESLYRLLRAVAPGLPVLFTTGREDLARSLDPGVAVLPKPFTDTELLAAVAAALA